MIASSAGHDEIVTLLLENGADVHVVNLTGQSGLHYAASKNRLSVSIKNHDIYCILCILQVKYL